MSQFSVKKPLTVFVAVIAVIVLGVVAYLNMTPDLLPNMDFPYIMIMTTYPGASPEKVEAEVTKPLEQSMSTLEHIKEVTSTSAENYSMVMLEFEDSVNLDTIGVDIQQSISALQGSWSDMVQAPYVLKINPSLLPVMVAAVSMEGMNTVQLTQLLDDGLMNKLEGITGVARVSTSGTVVQQIHLVLDQAKLDSLNETLTNQINKKMDEALTEINNAKYDLETAQKQLDSGKAQLDKGKQELTEQTSSGVAEVNYQLTQLVNSRAQVDMLLKVLKPIQSGLNTLTEQFTQTQKQLDTLKQLRTQLQDVESRQAAMDGKIAEIEGSGKPQEEIDAELAALKSSAEYVLLEADKAALQAQLNANKVTVQTLDARIALLEGTLTSLNKQIENLKKLLEEQGVALPDLDATVQEMESGLKQMDEGIEMLKSTQKTLNKAQMDGLLEMSKAATEMAVGQSTITAALTQIEQGEKTLEDTRKQTLAQTDLNKILTMDMVKNILTHYQRHNHRCQWRQLYGFRRRRNDLCCRPGESAAL